MAIFAASDRRFLEGLSRLAYANPFLPSRMALEREVLGEEFQPEPARVWSRRVDIDQGWPNIETIAARAIAVVDAACQALRQGKRASEGELLLYEDGVLYVLFDQFRGELQIVLQSALEGKPPPKIKCWPAFRRAFEGYLAVPDLTLPSRYDPAHIFAGFFQIRRAFHHIFDFIVGQSLPAAELRAAVWQSIFTHDLRRYRRSLYNRMSDITTLICGPSGTGKELVARAVGLSRYIPFDPAGQTFADDFLGSFHPVNLSALSPTLIESDLFGHCKGSFTGAVADRQGWLEACRPLGTVFLDEIGELDAAIQVKLLRVVQTRAFSRLGETKSRSFEGKVIAATNRHLATEMRAGRFREDLYYRLCSDLITTSSLHDQLADAPEDLHNLILFTAQRIAGDDAEDLTKEVESWIDEHLGRDYPWPGNIRELEQCVRNCLVRGEYRPQQWEQSRMEGARSWLAAAQNGTLSADELLSHYCRWIYAMTGTYEGAAERLGLDRRTVKKRVTEAAAN